MNKIYNIIWFKTKMKHKISSKSFYIYTIRAHETHEFKKNVQFVQGSLEFTQNINKFCISCAIILYKEYIFEWNIQI